MCRWLKTQKRIFLYVCRILLSSNAEGTANAFCRQNPYMIKIHQKKETNIQWKRNYSVVPQSVGFEYLLIGFLRYPIYGSWFYREIFTSLAAPFIRRINHRVVCCTGFLGHFDSALVIFTLLSLVSSETNATLVDNLFSAKAGRS